MLKQQWHHKFSLHWGFWQLFCFPSTPRDTQGDWNCTPGGKEQQTCAFCSRPGFGWSVRAGFLQPGVQVFWSKPTCSCVSGRDKKGFGMWGVYWLCVALKKSLVIDAIGLPKDQSWQFASATVLLVTFWLKLRPVIAFICKVVERVED